MGKIAEFISLFVIIISVGAAGNVEARGTLANLGMPEYTWDNSSFPGFCTDIDRDICSAETLTFRLSNANPASATLSDQADVNYYRELLTLLRLRTRISSSSHGRDIRLLDSLGRITLPRTAQQ